MTYELWVLVGAAIFGIVNVLLVPVAAASREGYLHWNAGPRDTPFDVGPVAERLKRAFSNFMETFAFFAVVVIALAFAYKSSDLSLWGARIYLTARVLYLPCYAFGIVYVRSAFWCASLAGLLMCLATLFL